MSSPTCSAPLYPGLLLFYAGPVSEARVLRLSDPAPVYLLWGEDHQRRKSAVLALRNAVLAMAPGLEAFHHERFEGPYVAGVDAVLASCRQVPLGCGRRLVELDQPEALGAQLKGTDASAKKKGGAMDALVAYLSDPVSSTVLLLSSPSLAGTSKLVKAAKAASACIEVRFAVAAAKDASADLARYARERGCKLGPGVAAAIIERVGAATAAWQDAVNQLAAQGGEGSIDRASVERVLARTQTGDIFALTDAVGRKDAATALKLLGPYFAAGEKNLELAMKLSAMLAWQLRRLMMVAAKPPRSPASLGMKPFVHQKLTEQARCFSWPQLVSLHAGLVKLDGDLKGGSPLGYHSPMLLLQRWVLEACDALPGARARASR